VVDPKLCMLAILRRMVDLQRREVAFLASAAGTHRLANAMVLVGRNAAAPRSSSEKVTRRRGEQGDKF
jgi:hypothetical protein